MNTTELISQVAVTESTLPRSKVASIVEKFLSAARTSLDLGEDVHLSGIGRLVHHSRPARAGRNPKTGAVISIPAKTFIKLNPVGELRNI